MAVIKYPSDLKGIQSVDQVSWAAGDPGAGYAALNAFDIKFVPGLTMHKPGYQKNVANRGPDPAAPGAKGGELTFKTYMRGGGGLASEFISLAKNSGYTVKNNADAAAEVVAGSAAGTLIVDNAATLIRTNDIVLVSGVATNTQMRIVTRVQLNVPVGDSTLDIAPNWEAGETPVATDSLYSVDTIIPANKADPLKYMTFDVYSGSGATDRFCWTLIGCAGTFKLAGTGADANPIAEWTFLCDDWTDAEASTAQVADTFKPVHPLLGDFFYVGNTATKITSIGFDPGCEMAPYIATEGGNGRAGWHYHGEEPVLDIMPYADIDWVAAWEIATEQAMFFESVKDEDEAWCLFVAQAQVMSLVEEDSGSELVGHKMELQINDPGYSTDAVPIPLAKFAIGITGL